MKIRIPQLFDGVMELLGLRTPTTSIDIQVKELRRKGVDIVNFDKLPPGVKNSPEIAELLTSIGKSIPSVRGGKEITTKQIQIDSAALLVTLASNGYQPPQLLLLLGNLYGSLMGDAPEEIGEDENGNSLSPEALEAEFFKLCRSERLANKRMREHLGIIPDIDRSKMN